MKKKPKKSLDEINELSRQLKRKRKRKGLPSGSRFNTEAANNSKSGTKKTIDPRLGSKKPVSLIVDASTTKTVKPTNKPAKIEKKVTYTSPEQELDHLENDPNLERLLDLIEQGTELTTKQQTELDNKLNRIETLMQQLGYIEQDDDDEEDYKKGDNIVSLLKG